MSGIHFALKLLSYVVQTPGALAPILWGGRGSAKSANVSALARALGMGIKTILAGIRDQTDFLGTGFPADRWTEMKPPRWAVDLADSGNAILFLDEASGIPPAVQHAMLRVVHERVVGDMEPLPDSVKIVLAANPPDSAAGGWDHAIPLSNRMVHIRWPYPTANEWADWALGKQSAAPSIAKLDIDAWEAEMVTARALCARYITTNPSALVEDENTIVGRFPNASATPRTWGEGVMPLLATCRAMKDDAALLPLTIGCIGEPQALPFCEWVQKLDLPDPEALLADPTSWEPNPRRIDQTFVVVSSVAAAATLKKPAKEYRARWEAGWNVLERAMSAGKDLVAVAAWRLSDKTRRPAGGVLSPKVQKLILELAPIIQASGILNDQGAAV